MIAPTRLLADNPVLVKEMRTRMRGARAYWILTGYLLFLAFILFVQYATWWSEAHSGGGMSAGSKVGQGFFHVMIAVQAFLVLFITPAVTSGAITVEREQRTMEMLEMTRLARSTIVAGKLMAAVSFVALLLVSSLPLTSLCFVLGGVSPEQVIYYYLILLVGSLVAGSLGLMWSAIARTTTAAVLYTYITIVVPPLAFMFLMIMAAVASFRGGGGPGSTFEMLFAVVPALFGLVTPDMMATGTQLGPFLQAWQMRHFYNLTLPMWVAPVTSYVLIGLILVAVAVSRLETFPERKAPLLRFLVVLFFLAQCFFLFGARFSPYMVGGAGLANLMRGYPLVGTLIYPVVLLLLCVPIFSCGELLPAEARRFGRWLLWGWTPAGLRRAKMSSGLPFLLGLAVVIFGMYWLSFVFIGQAGAAMTGNVWAGAPLAAAVAPRGRMLATAVPAPFGGLPEVIIVVCAAVIALWSFCLSLSAVIGNRWAALAISYAALMFVFIAPAIAQSMYQAAGAGAGPNAPSLLINIHYLNPVMSIAQIMDTSGSFWSSTPLAFGDTPMWIVTTLCYAFIAGVSLLMAVPFVTKTAVRPALPYDDMAAKA